MRGRGEGEELKIILNFMICIIKFHDMYTFLVVVILVVVEVVPGGAVQLLLYLL